MGVFIAIAMMGKNCKRLSHDCSTNMVCGDILTFWLKI